MKRSEMVKYIETELKDIVMENYIDKQGEAWCAELILKKIEELGMLPPFAQPTFDRSLGESKSEIKNYKWEPEDE